MIFQSCSWLCGLARDCFANTLHIINQGSTAQDKKAKIHNEPSNSWSDKNLKTEYNTVLP